MEELLEHVDVNGANFITTVEGYDIFEITTWQAAQNFTAGHTERPAGSVHVNGGENTFNNQITNGHLHLYFVTAEDENAVIIAVLNPVDDNEKTIQGVTYTCNFDEEIDDADAAAQIPIEVYRAIPGVALAIEEDEEEVQAPIAPQDNPGEDGNVQDVDPRADQAAVQNPEELIIDAEVIQDVVDTEAEKKDPEEATHNTGEKARFDLVKEPDKYQDKYSERDFSRLFELVRSKLTAWKADSGEMLGHFAKSKKYNELVIWDYNEDDEETPITILGTVTPNSNKKGQYTVFIDSWYEATKTERDDYREPEEGVQSGTFILKDAHVAATIEPVGNRNVRITDLEPLYDNGTLYDRYSTFDSITCLIPETINGFKVIDIAPFAFTNWPLCRVYNIVIDAPIKNLHKYTFYWGDTNQLQALSKDQQFRTVLNIAWKASKDVTVARNIVYVDPSMTTDNFIYSAGNIINDRSREGVALKRFSVVLYFQRHE